MIKRSEQRVALGMFVFFVAYLVYLQVHLLNEVHHSHYHSKHVVEAEHDHIHDHDHHHHDGEEPGHKHHSVKDHEFDLTKPRDAVADAFLATAAEVIVHSVLAEISFLVVLPFESPPENGPPIVWAPRGPPLI